ncbi:unnamed protein product [Paramecium sonneborni]|uniref:Uncharacterized protein n=1 Tax=Paramecium sonneborni TaxID=65129 RepID=A0A8S1KIZ2_9CILI|nr:unnamed protein product [Paramecium sonneborni]
MKQKKQQLGEININKQYNEQQLREIIQKLLAKEANYQIEIAKLKEQNIETIQKYHKALKQIGEMEKTQKKDQMYIQQIDNFLLEAKKRFDQNKKQQTDHYVDALLEMTKQRDEYLKRNIQLEIIVNEQNEQIDKLKRQTTIIPSASQQQFSNPLSTNEEVIQSESQVNHHKKSSIYSMNTQDSIINDEEKEDQLMTFLHQLDEQQANQLYSLFSSLNTDLDSKTIKKDPLFQNIISNMNHHSLVEQQSSFSFSQKWNDKENHYF